MQQQPTLSAVIAPFVLLPVHRLFGMWILVGSLVAELAAY